MTDGEKTNAKHPGDEDEDITPYAGGAKELFSTEGFGGDDWEGSEHANADKPFMTIEASQQYDLGFAKSREKAAIEIVRLCDWVEKRPTAGA